MKNVLAFISGSYNDPRGDYYIKQNILKAEYVSVELWKLGIANICPHKNSAWLSGIIDENNFYEGDLLMLSKCDLIVMMQGWQSSKGARLENEYATKHNIKIFQHPFGIEFYAYLTTL